MAKSRKVNTYKDQVYNIKQALKEINVTPTLLKGCYEYQSGFFEIEGYCFYFSCSPMLANSSSGEESVLWRIAKDTKDYTGGCNQYAKSTNVVKAALNYINFRKHQLQKEKQEPSYHNMKHYFGGFC